LVIYRSVEHVFALQAERMQQRNTKKKKRAIQEKKCREGGWRRGEIDVMQLWRQKRSAESPEMNARRTTATPFQVTRSTKKKVPPQREASVFPSCWWCLITSDTVFAVDTST
jgi:hypothetical protein